MKLNLYERRDEELWCTITAEIRGGALTVSGHDLGKIVQDFFGSDEYEYAVSLDKENTAKLFTLLGCAEASDEQKLNVIRQTFNNSRADSALKEYCREHGIKTSFWCWP